MDHRAGVGGKKRRPGRGEVAAPVGFLGLRAAIVLFLTICISACTHQPNAVQPPDPLAVLQAIPPANPAQYERPDIKKWRNPYLIIRADGVALYDSANSTEIILKTDEVLPALAGLPALSWPYGRVVAAAENGPRVSEQDAVAIRRNKGIVGGVLAGAHVAVKWVPAA